MHTLEINSLPNLVKRWIPLILFLLQWQKPNRVLSRWQLMGQCSFKRWGVKDNAIVFATGEYFRPCTSQVSQQPGRQTWNTVHPLPSDAAQPPEFLQQTVSCYNSNPISYHPVSLQSAMRYCKQCNHAAIMLDFTWITSFGLLLCLFRDNYSGKMKATYLIT